jgi:hypothetical protein
MACPPASLAAASAVRQPQAKPQFMRTTPCPCSELCYSSSTGWRNLGMCGPIHRTRFWPPKSPGCRTNLIPQSDSCPDHSSNHRGRDRQPGSGSAYAHSKHLVTLCFLAPYHAAAVGYLAPTVNVTGHPCFFWTQTGPPGRILRTSTGPRTSGAPASIST